MGDAAGFLPVASQPGEAIREGIRDTKFHQDDSSVVLPKSMVGLALLASVGRA